MYTCLIRYIYKIHKLKVQLTLKSTDNWSVTNYKKILHMIFYVLRLIFVAITLAICKFMQIKSFRKQAIFSIHKHEHSLLFSVS